MYAQYTNAKSVKVLLLTLAMAVSQNSFAATQDTLQEISINANETDGNLRSKIISYKKNVVIKQGSITITANEATVQSDSNDEKTYLLIGNPVTFSQTLSNKKVITLSANNMRYEPSIGLASISGKAKIIQEKNSISGELIVYDVQTEHIEGTGNPIKFHSELADGSPIDISAKQVFYKPTEFVVEVSGNATVKQEGTEARGSRIIYNTQTEQLNMESQSNETVTTIIKPKSLGKKQ